MQEKVLYYLIIYCNILHASQIMFVCMYVYMCVYVCVYVYRYACMYVMYILCTSYYMRGINNFISRAVSTTVLYAAHQYLYSRYQHCILFAYQQLYKTRYINDYVKIVVSKIVLCCVVLYCIVLCCIVLCCIVVVLYCIVLCGIVLYCIVFYCIVLCCIVCIVSGIVLYVVTKTVRSAQYQ